MFSNNKTNKQSEKALGGFHVSLGCIARRRRANFKFSTTGRAGSSPHCASHVSTKQGTVSLLNTALFSVGTAIKTIRPACASPRRAASVPLAQPIPPWRSASTQPGPKTTEQACVFPGSLNIQLPRGSCVTKTSKRKSRSINITQPADAYRPSPPATVAMFGERYPLKVYRFIRLFSKDFKHQQSDWLVI